MWGTPRKRALFGPEGPHSVSSVSDVAETQLGWPPDDEDLEVAQSEWPPGDEYLEEAWLTWWHGYRKKWRSSGQSPDRVAPEGWRFPLGPRAGPGLRRRRYPCMRENLVGTNIGKCLMVLFVRMGGTVSRRLCSLCLTSKGTPSTWPCWCRHPSGCCQEFC